jgi:hypothetical protein
LSSSSSHVESVLGADVRTCIGEGWLLPRVDTDRMLEVYRAARSRGADPGVENGYTLFWARGRTLQQLSLTARSGDYAVIGRHSRCDVHLRHDPEVSLRHLLARVRADQGAPLLELLDLHGRLPFHLVDDRPHHALAVHGPIVIRIGSYVLCGLPSGTEPGQLPDELPRPVVIGEPPLRVPAPPSEVSHIVLRESTASLFEITATGAPAGAIGRLRVERGNMRVSAWVAPDVLGRGILLGRYRRCLDHGVRDLLGESVSRAHTLVIGDEHGVLAYDLCSRNGTFSGERRVRCVRLMPGRRIALARPDGVLVEWRDAGS